MGFPQQVGGAVAVLIVSQKYPGGQAVGLFKLQYCGWPAVRNGLRPKPQPLAGIARMKESFIHCYAYITSISIS